jgi:hypothetical protein
MPQDPKKRKPDNGGKEEEIELEYAPPDGNGSSQHGEDTQLLPVGTGIHQRVSANAIPGIDAIKELQKLKLISGITIQIIPEKQLTILDKQQQRDKQPNQIPGKLSEYIYPSDLKEVDGIKTWQLEIALLQLQWRFDTHVNPDAQQTPEGLNDLGCISAFLGRYQNARDYLNLAQGATPTKDTLTIIKENLQSLQDVYDVIKQQDYWGKIGGSQ